MIANLNFTNFYQIPYNLGIEGETNIRAFFNDITELECTLRGHPNILTALADFVDEIDSRVLPEWTANVDIVSNKTQLQIYWLMSTSLAQLIDQHKSRRALAKQSMVPEVEFVTITTGLVDAIAFLQDKRVAHRNIKPGNFRLIFFSLSHNLCVCV